MTVYLILAAYLLFTVITGLVTYRQSKETPEDYFLAGRGVGLLVLFFTLVATNFSAFFFLGFAGKSYQIGYSYYAMMAFGTAFAGISMYLIGTRAWKLGKKRSYITPPELIGDLSGSKPLKIIYLVVMVFFTVPYLAIQPIGGGIILSELTNGQIPYFAGALCLTAFIVLYVFLGGMRSVAITDLFQGVLMFSLIGLAVWYIGHSLGGLKEANTAVYKIKPELFSREGAGGYFTPQRWFSLMALWFFCVPMFPHIFMRFFIAKEVKSLTISTILYAFVPSFLFICPVIIGVLGHLSFPGLEGTEVDKILPMMMNKHAPLWLAGLIMVGALAAFMSTLDSQLLALSTMITRDLYLPYINKTATFKKQIAIGRILVVLLAALGLLIAYQPPGAIFTIVKHTFTGYAVLFPATFAIMYFPKTSPAACFVSIAAGEALLLAVLLDWLPMSYLGGFEPVVPIILLATLIIIGGSLITVKNRQ